MDLLSFIAAVVQSLSWPVAALVLAYMLRKPVRELIPQLRKLKYKDLEMDFAREIAEIRAELPQLPSPTTKPEIEQIPEEPVRATTAVTNRLAEKHGNLLRMTQFSTRVAILESWLEVEAAAVEVASSFWSRPPSDVFRDDPRLGEYLLQCKVIDEKMLDAYRRLRKLRNKAAHAVDFDLSEEDARNYVELAMELASRIRSSTET